MAKPSKGMNIHTWFVVYRLYGLCKQLMPTNKPITALTRRMIILCVYYNIAEFAHTLHMCV